MRVRSRSTESRDVVSAPTGSTAKRAAATAVGGTFKTQFAAVSHDLASADLDYLLQEVDRTALELKHRRGRSQLVAYRKAVQAFVRTAVERMYSVQHATRFDRRGMRVSSVIVQLIDEHLEAVTAAVLHGDESVLPLAARLDEIRGLLLDLYG